MFKFERVFEENTGFVYNQNALQEDMCKCSACCNTFKVDDCETEHDHHDGWEMPAYTEILCPTCEGGGCIDDFFFSKEL